MYKKISYIENFIFLSKHEKICFFFKYEFSCILKGEKQNKTLIKRIIKKLLYNVKVYVLFMNFI